MVHRTLKILVLILLLSIVGTAPAGAAGLQRFASCGDLQKYADARAVGYDGFVSPVMASPRMPTVAPSPTEGPGEAAPPTAVTDRSQEVSTTNNQEQDVDEADYVKATAKRLLIVSGGALLVVDISGPEPKLASRLEIEGAQELLLRGDRALVLGSVVEAVGGDTGADRDARVGAGVSYGAYRQRVTLTEIDFSDPLQPKIRRSLSVNGSYDTARLTGRIARVVIRTRPEVMDKAQASAAKTARFVPRSTIKSKLTGKSYTRAVVPCNRVRRSLPYSGLSLTAVLTVEIDDGLQNVDRDAVLADPDTVYASTTGTYIAAHKYIDSLDSTDDIPAGTKTDIHRFVTSAAGETEYAGSGSVSGLTLNQFSLSEHNGVLRIATTNEPTWLADGTEATASQSRVTTLAPGAGKSLKRLGEVAGLGRGERIYAVRFVGDTGYLVTFRQMDPLYVVDLSVPAGPKVRGELKIPGYSAYLHPIAAGRLLGVGASATDQGQITGSQIALFDVSDPAAPKQLDAEQFANDQSAVEADHRAFLWWGPRNLAVVPLGYGPGSGQVVTVAGDALKLGARLPFADGGNVRTIVAGDRLLLISSSGIRQYAIGSNALTGGLDLPAGDAGSGGIPVVVADRR